MAAVFHMAGFEVWDVNMEDLCQGDITLDRFQGLVFVGGFSYADVLGSAKGNMLELNVAELHFLNCDRRRSSLSVCAGRSSLTEPGFPSQSRAVMIIPAAPPVFCTVTRENSSVVIHLVKV